MTNPTGELDSQTVTALPAYERKSGCYRCLRIHNIQCGRCGAFCCPEHATQLHGWQLVGVRYFCMRCAKTWWAFCIALFAIAAIPLAVTQLQRYLW